MITTKFAYLKFKQNKKKKKRAFDKKSSPLSDFET